MRDVAAQPQHRIRGGNRGHKSPSCGVTTCLHEASAAARARQCGDADADTGGAPPPTHPSLSYPHSTTGHTGHTRPHLVQFDAAQLWQRGSNLLAEVHWGGVADGPEPAAFLER